MAKPQDPLWNYELWCATKLSWLSIIEFTTTTQIHVYWFSYDGVFNKAPISWDFLGISSPVSGKGDCAYYTIRLERRQLDWIVCLYSSCCRFHSFASEKNYSQIYCPRPTLLWRNVLQVHALSWNSFFFWLISFSNQHNAFFFSNYRAGNRLSQTQGTYSAWCNSLR